MKHNLLILTLLMSLSALPAFAQTEPTLASVLMGYTYKVESGIPGKRVYISCQRPINEQGEVVGKGNLTEQTRQVFDNLKAALSRVGGTLDDIQQVSYRIKDLSANKSALDKGAAAFLPNDPQIKEFKDVQSQIKDDVILEVEVVAVMN